MDKLIELLNEYDSLRTYKRYKDKWWRLWRYWELLHWDTWVVNAKLQCISKSYWFIQWLVDNDKIDFDIVKADTTRPIRDNMNKYTLEDYTRYERVLMLLSIQDNPIEFLISILK